MKVLHVISDENIGGAGVLLTSLLRVLDRNQIESVVALPCGSHLIDRIVQLEVPILELKHPCDRINGRSIWEIEKFIRLESCDLIHTNAAICARIAGKMACKKVIHTRHCCFPPSKIWKNQLVRSVGGRINSWLSDAVIATADAAAENLYQLGVSPKKVEVIINGSMPVRTVSDAELALARKRYRINENDYCIGICARLEPYKGQKVFLDAAKEIMTRFAQKTFCFLIIGTGVMEMELKRYADSLGILPFVRFTGFVEDMATIYRLLRINVNCSSGTETSCLALSEGMSASLPFVASDYGGNISMLGGSEAGFLFETNNPIALADQLCKIIENPELENRMKIAALARFEEKYTAAGMGNALTAVYQKLMNH